MNGAAATPPQVQAAGLPAFATLLWRLLLGTVLLASVALLSGCAQTAGKNEPAENTWSGRLALQVEGNSAQSFAAQFDLQGDVRRGALVLSSPFGTQLAQVSWEDGHAQLLAPGQPTQTSDSLDKLLEDALGARIPVAALFQWLRGEQAAAPGWDADTTQMSEGRLVARRHSPQPAAVLRITLSR